MVRTYNAEEQYQQWLAWPDHPASLKEQLEGLREQPDTLFDSFYRSLSFGTGGMRGVLGPGTNRMNIYTVRRATYGFAQYLRATSEGEPSVVIGYDGRRQSAEFALEAGLVMAAAGVTAFVFQELCPTPELSFAVREFGASGGIMITASHNPPEYNGYKVYNKTGGQILDDEASAITAQIEQVEDWFSIPRMHREEAEAAGLLRWVSESLEHRYVERVVQALQRPTVSADARRNLRIVYSALHGTGNRPVLAVLEAAGYTQVHTVQSQAEPHPEFPTVASPNPEEPEAFSQSLTVAQQWAADVVFATDPDADRVGVAVRKADGEYTLLTGNQTGALLVDFWLEQLAAERRLPHRGVVFKTIVTSEFGAQLARRHRVDVEDTLTGFKYIGAKASEYERTGEKTFLFGYEESYGYLAAPLVRDKDAVQICLLLAEMAAFYKERGQNLLDVLEQRYKTVGFFAERLFSKTLPGADGMSRMAALMQQLRADGIRVDGLQLAAVEDYWLREKRWVNVAASSSEPLSLPKADVLKFIFTNGSWLAVRPSGTEPKMKVYVGARGETRADCDDVLHRLSTAANAILSS